MDLSLPVDANATPPEVVERLLEHTADLAASDVYFCTNETHVAVHIRHLGMPRLAAALPLDLGRRCLAHVKTIAGMDANERRRPLDGRWVHERPGGAVYDLRIETVPTLFGEDMALRLFDRHSRLLSTGRFGLTADDHDTLSKLLQSPGGLILPDSPFYSTRPVRGGNELVAPSTGRILS